LPLHVPIQLLLFNPFPDRLTDVRLVFRVGPARVLLVLLIRPLYSPPASPLFREAVVEKFDVWARTNAGPVVRFGRRCFDIRFAKRGRVRGFRASVPILEFTYLRSNFVFPDRESSQDASCYSSSTSYSTYNKNGFRSDEPGNFPRGRCLLHFVQNVLRDLLPKAYGREGLS
jgi:hypothetical protein